MKAKIIINSGDIDVEHLMESLKKRAIPFDRYENSLVIEFTSRKEFGVISNSILSGLPKGK